MTRACRLLIPVVLLAVGSLTAPDGVLAQGDLNVYSSVQAEWCQAAGAADVLERTDQARRP
jgi:hypothetical protein